MQPRHVSDKNVQLAYELREAGFVDTDTYKMSVYRALKTGKEHPPFPGRNERGYFTKYGDARAHGKRFKYDVRAASPDDAQEAWEIVHRVVPEAHITMHDDKSGFFAIWTEHG